MFGQCDAQREVDIAAKANTLTKVDDIAFHKWTLVRNTVANNLVHRTNELLLAIPFSSRAQ
jgi:hypothetical protein